MRCTILLLKKRGKKLYHFDLNEAPREQLCRITDYLGRQAGRQAGSEAWPVGAGAGRVWDRSSGGGGGSGIRKRVAEGRGDGRAQWQAGTGIHPPFPPSRSRHRRGRGRAALKEFFLSLSYWDSQKKKAFLTRWAVEAQNTCWAFIPGGPSSLNKKVGLSGPTSPIIFRFFLETDAVFFFPACLV